VAVVVGIAVREPFGADDEYAFDVFVGRIEGERCLGDAETILTARLRIAIAVPVVGAQKSAQRNHRRRRFIPRHAAATQDTTQDTHRDWGGAQKSSNPHDSLSFERRCWTTDPRGAGPV